jgi:hypothetical protein
MNTTWQAQRNFLPVGMSESSGEDTLVDVLVSWAGCLLSRQTVIVPVLLAQRSGGREGGARE